MRNLDEQLLLGIIINDTFSRPMNMMTENNGAHVTN